jgi:hypothetical protein
MKDEAYIVGTNRFTLMESVMLREFQITEEYPEDGSHTFLRNVG